MTLQEIMEKSSKETRIAFLQGVVKEFAKKDISDFYYEEWEQSIRNQCESVRIFETEETYRICYCNIQILDPHETKSGQAFRISVWIIESFKYDNNSKEIEYKEEHVAFDWEE